MRRIITLVGATSLLCSGSMQAVTFNLFESAVNFDGVITLDPVPGLGFNAATGQGHLQVTITGVGKHYGGLFVDFDMDAPINTFFNELGTAHGAPPAGLSWEIDEPGWAFGDIFKNFEASSLDNSNALAGPEDVSMALAWAFTLDVDETATLNFYVDPKEPFGFSLQHTDPDSDASLYFSTSMRIAGGGGPGAPDGGSTMLLLLGAGAVLVGYRSRSQKG